MPEEVRRFTHKDGFKDDVAWIECYRNKDLLFVLQDGNKIKGIDGDILSYEKMVKQGIWVELKPFKIYSSSAEQIQEDWW